MVAGRYNNFYLINTVDMKEIIKMSISCNDQSDISRANTKATILFQNTDMLQLNKERLLQKKKRK